MKTLSGDLPNIVKLLRERFSLHLRLFGDNAITRYHVTFIAISLMDNHHCSLTMTNSDKTQHFMISQMNWITEINQYRSTSIDGEIAGLQMMLLQTCHKLA